MKKMGCYTTQFCPIQVRLIKRHVQCMCVQVTLIKALLLSLPVEEVLRDFKGRRATLIKALTTSSYYYFFISSYPFFHFKFYFLLFYSI